MLPHCSIICSINNSIPVNRAEVICLFTSMTSLLLLYLQCMNLETLQCHKNSAQSLPVHQPTHWFYGLFNGDRSDLSNLVWDLSTRMCPHYQQPGLVHIYWYTFSIVFIAIFAIFKWSPVETMGSISMFACTWIWAVMNCSISSADVGAQQRWENKSLRLLLSSNWWQTFRFHAGKPTWLCRKGRGCGLQACVPVPVTKAQAKWLCIHQIQSGVGWEQVHVANLPMTS